MTDQTGHAQVLAAMEEGEFRGFVCSLIQGDLLHIIYFAVTEDQRGRGLGSQILAAVREASPGISVTAIPKPRSATPGAERTTSFSPGAGALPRKSFTASGTAFPIPSPTPNAIKYR